MEPISIPEDVSLKFMELPKVRSRHIDAAASIVEITGPQGKEVSMIWKMSADTGQGQQNIPLPGYISTTYDAANRKVIVSVADPHEKHQKSMWGMLELQDDVKED